VLCATSEPGACTLIGHAGGFNVATAALCNGTAAHGEDFDDTFEGGPVHAGAVIVPAVLAAAEQHALAGSDFARGVAVGCEVMCRLCLPAPKRVHEAGFHPTAVFGALGAAAGVASALRLSDSQWWNALGIAGSMASGIIEYLAEGAWTKRMHPGWAAHAGYRAARLAQAGFTGPRTLFDGEHGFFHAFANSDGCDFTAMLEGAGQHWLCSDIAFKPYACGTMAHPYIDCARKLVAEGVVPGEITSLLESIEGSGTDDWPPSPPLQSLHIESLPNGRRAALLVGMAGRSHWSASIETVKESAEILFDLACRHAATPKQIGSRYRALPSAKGRIEILPEESHLTCDAKIAGDEITIEPAWPNISSATTRWKYRVQLLPASTEY
jgi:hypothetical protein